MLLDIYELQRRARDINDVLPNSYRAVVYKSLVKIPSAPNRIIIEKLVSSVFSIARLLN